MTRLEFTVVGRPVPAGSKTGFAVRKGGVLTGQVAMAESNQRRVRPWQAELKAAAQEALDGGERLAGPLILEVDFYLDRPAGHFGSGRNAGVLRAAAPRYPAVRPDATKLLRGVEDALTGIVWGDDAQIVIQAVRKRYGTPPRTEVLVAIVPPGLEETGAREPDEAVAWWQRA